MILQFRRVPIMLLALSTIHLMTMSLCSSQDTSWMSSAEIVERVTAQAEALAAWDEKTVSQTRKLVLADLNQRLDKANDEFSNRIVKERRLREVRVITEILNDYRFNHNAIVSGEALNRLLADLARVATDLSSDSVEKAAQLHPSVLQHIHVWSPGAGYKQAFALTQKTGLSLDSWPIALRGKEFSKARNALVDALNAASRASKPGEQIAVELLNEAKNAYRKLRAQFDAQRARSDPKEKTATGWHEEYLADKRLREIERSIGRIRDRGTTLCLGNGLPFEPARDGKDVGTFVSWMVANGVTFAPAPPENSYAYHRLFTKMRQYYQIRIES